VSVGSEKVLRWKKVHPEKNREQARRWAHEHPEYLEARRKAHARRMVKLRQEAVEALGGVCVGCQCSDIRCLQIDHIIPLKGQKRIAVSTFYLSVIRGAVENLQVLCANCHAIKTYDENGGRGG
jgi:5-methylcytosine-specific restriction endonuclease McrA